ncbi:MAG: hypothetical protein HYV18_07165 [Gammaproteobacteria bacterium]|nr:hypothetical protein [Gammaproteobacteria bacterium]
MPPVLLLAACQSLPREVAAGGAAPPPAACAPGAVEAAADLVLPPAAPPPDLRTAKGAPYRNANAIPVNGGIRDIGRWSVAAPGWAVWRLRLESEGARSLAVRLHPFNLPARAELWVCGPEGSVRHGPFRERGPAGEGELWSPVVKGSELRLEVLAPVPSRAAVELGIVEAYAAFR